MPTRPFHLGRARAVQGEAPAADLALPAHHLVTHGVLVGMTGSGKTGLLMVTVEEALRSRVPVLLVDIKGDLPNLLLSFPELSAAEFLPWVDADAAHREGLTPEELAERTAARWREGLAKWGLGPPEVRAFREGIAPRILTPGTTAGEPLHLLSSLEHPGELWDVDEEAAREGLSATLSLLLRLCDRDADPTRSREHVVLAHLAERRLRAGLSAGLRELLADLASPPLATIGAMPLDDFLPPRERTALSQQLNTLLASPTFASWRQGAPLDVGAWLAPKDGKTPAVILSVAHLDDGERAQVLGLVLEQIFSWVRGLAGTGELRALVVFDEVYGFLPPHPANPPTKKPLLGLLKQARAFGVGVVLATQNPMDLDYKALSNAGVWFVGRLQTDADRERVVEGLAGSDAGAGGLDPQELGATLRNLPPRSFFLRDVHATPSTALLESRWALSWLRGPMTRRELRKLQPRSEAPKPATTESPSEPTAGAPLAPASPVAAAAPVASTVEAPPAAPPTLLASAPAAPEGWAVFHGWAPAEPVDRWTYKPWVAATAVVHLREARTGAAVLERKVLAAPLTAEGRPDTTKAILVEAAHLRFVPPAGARYSALPEILRTKKGALAAEKALREHAQRVVTATLGVHKGLGLVQASQESAEDFAKRCREAAQREAAAEKERCAQRHSTTLRALEQEAARAREKLEQARRTHQSAPGALGAAVAGVFGGRRAASRASSAKDKAATRVDREERSVESAERELREALATRDRELLELEHEAARAEDAIEQRVLTARKSDIELTDLGIAWAAR